MSSTVVSGKRVERNRPPTDIELCTLPSTALRSAGAFGHFSSEPPLLQRMTAILRAVQLLGLYPLPLVGVQPFNRVLSFNKAFLLVLLSLIFFLLNLSVLSINVYITVQLTSFYGWLYPMTLSSVVTGLKPLINFVNFLIFWISAMRHRRFLRDLMIIDNHLIELYDSTPNMRAIGQRFFCFIILSALIPMSLRAIEYIWMSEQPGESLLNDLSLVLVPLLSIWNMIPLAYFWVINVMLRSYFRALHQALRKDVHLREKSLRFYFNQFRKLSQMTTKMTLLFTPFLAFTIFWTVLTLCLSINFLTQTGKFLPMELERAMKESQGNSIIVYFNLGYCVMQCSVLRVDFEANLIVSSVLLFSVLISIIYLIAMCTIGTVTNEAARAIINTVLEIPTEEISEIDRYRIVCFVHKVQTQHMWGVTVWWAVSMERNMLFTMFSAVVTYALLLLKLKESGPKESSPTMNHVFDACSTINFSSNMSSAEQCLLAAQGIWPNIMQDAL